MMGPSYKAMLGTHVHNANAISHKVEKEGKPHGKNPPPKREMKKDAWIYGVIKTPHYDIHPIYTIESDKKRKRDRMGSPPLQRRVSNNDCFDEEADP